MKQYKSKFLEALTPTSEMVSLDQIQQFLDSGRKVIVIESPSGVGRQVASEIDFPYLNHRDVFKAYSSLISRGKTHYVLELTSTKNLDKLRQFIDMTDSGYFEKIIILVPKSNQEGNYENWSSTNGRA